jgi:hypothetical protein
MILIFAIIFAVAWLLGCTVFHVASAAIHLLLVLAVACVIGHLVRCAHKPDDRLR